MKKLNDPTDQVDPDQIIVDKVNDERAALLLVQIKGEYED